MDGPALVRSRRGVLFATAGVGEPSALPLAQERRLAAAVLVNAILCLACPSFRRHIFKHARPADVEVRVARDRAWLMRDSYGRHEGPGLYWLSFRACCEALELDPDAVREQVVRRGWVDGRVTITWQEAKSFLQWSAPGARAVGAGNARRRRARRGREKRAA